jgi:hypothetical protein
MNMIKQMAIYREDKYWAWKIVDSGDRSIFANDKFFTRIEALNNLVPILKAMLADVVSRKN